MTNPPTLVDAPILNNFFNASRPKQPKTKWIEKDRPGLPISPELLQQAINYQSKTIGTHQRIIEDISSVSQFIPLGHAPDKYQDEFILGTLCNCAVIERTTLHEAARRFAEESRLSATALSENQAAELPSMSREGLIYWRVFEGLYDASRSARSLINNAPQDSLNSYLFDKGRWGTIRWLVLPKKIISPNEFVADIQSQRETEAIFVGWNPANCEHFRAKLQAIIDNEGRVLRKEILEDDKVMEANGWLFVQGGATVVGRRKSPATGNEVIVIQRSFHPDELKHAVISARKSHAEFQALQKQ